MISCRCKPNSPLASLCGVGMPLRSTAVRTSGSTTTVRFLSPSLFNLHDSSNACHSHSEHRSPIYRNGLRCRDEDDDFQQRFRWRRDLLSVLRWLCLLGVHIHWFRGPAYVCLEPHIPYFWSRSPRRWYIRILPGCPYLQQLL